MTHRPAVAVVETVTAVAVLRLTVEGKLLPFVRPLVLDIKLDMIFHRFKKIVSPPSFWSKCWRKSGV